MLEGQGRLHLDGQEEVVAPGDAVVAKAGVAHGVANDGPDPLVLMVVVTPPPPHA